MHLIFDFDGTIVDPKHHMWVSYRDGISRYKLRPMTQRAYMQKKSLGLREDVIVSPVLHGKELVAYLNWKKRHIEDDVYVASDRVYPHIKRVLAALAKLHTLYLVTNRQKQQVLVRELERLGIARYFQEVYAVAGKPDFVQAKVASIGGIVGQLPTETSAVRLIGDTEIELETAKALHIPVIVVGWGTRSTAFLKAHGAKTIVQTPQELLKTLS